MARRDFFREGKSSSGIDGTNGNFDAGSYSISGPPTVGITTATAFDLDHGLARA
jgi:hypothetical protein